MSVNTESIIHHIMERISEIGYVKPEDVKAKYESGVLTVLIPKEEPKKLTSGSKIAIE